MGDATEPREPARPDGPRRPEDDGVIPLDEHMLGDRAAPGSTVDDGLPGHPLTVLLFTCAEHGEEQVVDYYDPESPPRCSRGDLMVRKAR
jgi:hypothetical protein